MRGLLLFSGVVVLTSCAAGENRLPGTGGQIAGTGGMTASSSSSSSSTSSSTSGTGGSSSSSTSSSSTSSSTTTTTSTSTSSTSTSTSSSSSSSSSSTSSSSGSVGPVDIGVYSFTAIPPFGVSTTPVDPPSAAWHPSGNFALILNYGDAVYRYDPAQPAAMRLTQVGSAGSTVSWRGVTFTPDGSKAVLLGNTSTEGRVYLWDSASQQLTQMTSETFAGGTYEALAFSHDGTTARLLGSKKNGSSGYLAYLWPFDPATGRDLAGVKATATSAGCQDLAWATDPFGFPAVAVVCGNNGATLFYVDGGNNITTFTGNTGNTSRISARPQGDYALSLVWSDDKVTFFRQGLWTTGFNEPFLPGTFGVRFSTDGKRALYYGGQGRLWEFRHDLETQADFTDVSIPSFSMPPYNATSQSALNDVAWRPGCDGGLIVGGANGVSSTQALIIKFSVDNGVACAN